jgi:hypothetical protein
MRDLTAFFVLLLFALAALNCGGQPPSTLQSVRSETPTPLIEPTPDLNCQSYIPDQFGNPMTETERKVDYTNKKLSYEGYEVIQVRRRVVMNADDRRAPRMYEDLPYVIIKRQGKIVARFLGQAEHLAEVQFGLVSLLGGSNKQLVIEQTANKYWRYWIVNLQPGFEVIYDSGRYDLVYWLRAIDFDHDGRFELVQNLGTFWYVLGDNGTSPRPEIILKYDPTTHKYLPANPLFQNEVLRDIGQRITRGQEIRRNNGFSCPSLVYDVTLRYLYAGRKREAWNFFKREYEQDNKREQESSIKGMLRRDRVYRTIYQRQ